MKLVRLPQIKVRIKNAPWMASKSILIKILIKIFKFYFLNHLPYQPSAAEWIFERAEVVDPLHDL